MTTTTKVILGGLGLITAYYLFKSSGSATQQAIASTTNAVNDAQAQATSQSTQAGQAVAQMANTTS